MSLYDGTVLDPTYQALTADDDPNKQLAGLISPASAQSLVLPPPTQAPQTAPGQTTPQTGNLTQPSGGAQPVPRPGLAGQMQRQMAAYRAQQASVQPVNPDPTGSLRPGGSNPAMPVLPAAVSQVAPAPQQKLAQDQGELQRLQQTGSGVSQVHNPFLRGAGKVLDIAGSILAPGVAQYIPGSTLNNQRLQAVQQGRVANDQGQIQAAAQTADIQSQQAEREAQAHKADALAATDAPFNPTPEQAAAVGHPEIAGLPISQRTYATMLKAKEDNAARVQVGAGHDAAGITRTGMRDQTSLATNAATNATRVQTSKYGHSGAGVGSPKATAPVGEPGDLSAIPANIRATVQAIGEGREAPPTLTRKEGKEMMQYVNQAYPDYDASQFHNYQATRTEFSKGKTGQAINSFNTALTHLGRMEDNLPKNGSIPALNYLKNQAADLSGSPANKAFEADQEALSSEIGKAYKNGALTEGEHKDYVKLLSRDDAPAQQHANLNELKQLLSGKLSSYQQQLSTSLPTGAVRGFQIVSPEAATVLNRGQKGAPPAVQPVGGTLPPQAAKVLSEGKVHTFNNGQSWTLRGGQPVRVR